MLVSWGAGRSLLVRAGNAAPGGRRLWDGSPSRGVSHVMFGPPNLGQRQITEGAAEASRLPDDDLTRLPVWVAPDPAAAG